MKTITIDGIEYDLVQKAQDPKRIFTEEVTFPRFELHFACKGMTWGAAMKYAKILGEGWRLPTKEELQALASQLREFKNGCFWSTSTVSDSTNGARIVDLAHGDTYYSFKDATYGVVCVRP